MAKKGINIGAEVDKLAELDDKLKEVRAQERKLKAAYDDQVSTVLEVLESTGQEGAKGKLKSVTIVRQEVGKVEDADKFWNFVFRNKARELLQMRVSNPAYLELLASRKGKPVPGMETIEVKKLSVHSR